MPITYCLGNINAGELRVEYVQALLTVAPKAASTVVECDLILHQPSGPYLDDARNLVVENFLNLSTADWLLFVDSDIGFTLEDVEQLLQTGEELEAKAVGGAYFSPRAGVFYTVAYRWAEATGGEINAMAGRLLAPVPLTDIQHSKSPEKVDAIGTGFLAIHRSVLEEMRTVWAPPQPWFAEVVEEGVHLGEDLTFCLRLADMGYPVYLHAGVRVTHYKTVGLGGDLSWGQVPDASTAA